MNISSTYKKPGVLETLLLCRDPKTLNILHPLLQSSGTETQVCTDSDLAVEMLARWRFDAIVVDCDDMPRGEDVLRSLRSAPSNRTAIVFALVSGHASARRAFQMGATFVLDKPLAREKARSSLRAAYGLMLFGRRRYFRHPVSLSATFSTASGERADAAIVNLSEGGAGLETRAVLAPGQVGHLTFALPDRMAPIEIHAAIVWSKPGKAGLRFLNLAPAVLTMLREWLAGRFEDQVRAGVVSAVGGVQ